MNGGSETVETLQTLIDRVVRHLIREGITISAMESCTGGLFSSFLTDTPGSSDIFAGAFVAYSNEAKIRCGVPADLIARCGVYSPETAGAMAEACRASFGTDIGVGITGTTGNADPHNADSVPGEVCFAIVWGERRSVCRKSFPTDGESRRQIKERIALETARALAALLGIML